MFRAGRRLRYRRRPHQTDGGRAFQAWRSPARRGPTASSSWSKAGIDAYWADHLTAALDEALRGGADRISLDLHGVAYLSSGGIRALLVAYRELGRVGGALRIVRPSNAVKSMLEMAGLLDLLVLSPTEPKAIAARGRELALPEGSVESWKLEGGGAVECRAIGDPSRLETGFDASHCRSETFPAETFGFGLGAFGRDFEDCRGRFGELLAAGGAAVYLPTDGTNVPDFLIAGDGSAPEVRLLYGMRCAGPLTTHARFEAAAEKTFSLSALAAIALDLLGSDRAGVIVVGEAAGLVGASLRRSPALAGEAPDFDFPEIRRWLSFTPDRAFPSSQALIVGVASRGAATANGAGPPTPTGDGPARSCARSAPPACRATSTPRRSRTGRCRADRSSSRPPSRACSRSRLRAVSST